MSDPTPRERTQERQAGNEWALFSMKSTVILLSMAAILLAPAGVLMAMLQSAPFFGTQPSAGQLAGSASLVVWTAVLTAVAAVCCWIMCSWIWSRSRFVSGGILTTLLTLVALVVIVLAAGVRR